MIDEGLAKNSILESAKEAFETMIFLPFEETGEDETQTDDSDLLVCSITFTGQLLGCFLVQCDKTCAEKIAKGMLMIEGDDPLAETEICDALGEVVNIILGGIKSRLSGAVVDLNVSIPSMIKGQQIRPLLGRKAKRITVTARAADSPLKLMMAYVLQ